MSIMRMRRRFAVHLRYILYAIIIVFVLTLPAIFVPRSGRGSREDSGPDRLQETIAKVDGAPLTRGALERVYARTSAELAAMAQVTGYPIGIERLSRGRLQAFEDAVLELLVMREAEKQGIKISKRQIGKRATELAKQQLDQLKLQLKGEQLQRQLAYIASHNDGRPRTTMNERSFLRWFVKFMTQNRGDDLRAELATQELQKRVTAAVNATEQELLATYDEIRLREIVVAFHPQDKPERTDEQARARAEKLLEKLRKGADFAELARTESDDEDAKYTGGLQQETSFADLAPAYQKALANLKPGDLVPSPIETDRGYHLVKLERRQQRRPEDYATRKKDYLKDFTQRKRNTAWQEYTRQLRAKAKVEVSDPEILAYQEIQQGNREKALPLLRQATPVADQLGGLVAASVYFELAISYSVQNQWKEAAEAYGAASDALSGEQGIPHGRVQALMGMARCYENLHDYEQAVKWYQVAADESSVPSIHEDLLFAYQRMGKADLVKREQQWLDDYRRQEQEREKALREQQRKMEEEAAKKRPRPQPQSPRP